jgi:dystonin
MNHKKSRLTDLFRKIDKNGDSLIPREDFIEGIIKTSKLILNETWEKYLTNFSLQNLTQVDWR